MKTAWSGLDLKRQKLLAFTAAGAAASPERPESEGDKCPLSRKAFAEISTARARRSAANEWKRKTGDPLINLVIQFPNKEPFDISR